MVPASAIEWLARVRPDWDLAVMDDSGHCPQIEAPDEFVAIYDAWSLPRSAVQRMSLSPVDTELHAGRWAGREVASEGLIGSLHDRIPID